MRSFPCADRELPICKLVAPGLHVLPEKGNISWNCPYFLRDMWQSNDFHLRENGILVIFIIDKVMKETYNRIQYDGAIYKFE